MTKCAFLILIAAASALTAQTLSQDEQTSLQLDQMTAGRVRVKYCTLFETDTSFARYYE